MSQLPRLLTSSVCGNVNPLVQLSHTANRDTSILHDSAQNNELEYGIQQGFNKIDAFEPIPEEFVHSIDRHFEQLSMRSQEMNSNAAMKSWQNDFNQFSQEIPAPQINADIVQSSNQANSYPLHDFRMNNQIPFGMNYDPISYHAPVELYNYDSSYASLQSSSSSQVTQEASLSSVNEQSWTLEFDKFRQDFDFGETITNDQIFNDLSGENDWKAFENEWEKMNSGSIPALNATYTYAENNTFEQMSSPLEVVIQYQNEIGQTNRKYSLADVIMALEACVKGNHTSQQYTKDNLFYLLGSYQAENEKELNAIAAFRECLKENPSNLEATMALAVSLTNEDCKDEAISSLRDWLGKNEKYRDLITTDLSAWVSDTQQTKSADIESVKKMFMRAIWNGGTVDIDHHLQIGLGLLFHIENDYDKAVDCFKTALQVTPQDYLVWNKVGATLANSQNYEEAIHAYHRALELNPYFTRARYNLAVSCVNLGVHDEAIKQLMTALRLQQKSSKEPGNSTDLTSENIWDILQRVLAITERHDLISACLDRNLEGVKSGLQIS